MNPQTGPLYALLAYGAWGLLPVYWKFFWQYSGGRSVEAIA